MRVKTKQDGPEQIAKTRQEERLEREAKTTQALRQFILSIDAQPAPASGRATALEEWLKSQRKKRRDAEIDRIKQDRLRKDAELARRYNEPSRPKWKGPGHTAAVDLGDNWDPSTIK